MIRTPCCPIHQHRDKSQHASEDDSEMGAQDRFVRFIDIVPHEPFVLYSLDNQESSGSNFPHDANVIDGVVEDV